MILVGSGLIKYTFAMIDGLIRPEGKSGHEAVREEICDRCGHFMNSIHCKILCPNCGFMRDCSDP